jgi:hypothetical protein
MPIPAQLVELRSRLEMAGMVVVEEPDHLNVRLPFFCSVRVHSDGSRLRFESYFGVVSRVRSTTLKLGGASLVAIAAARYGATFAGIAAFLAVIAGIYDGIRWQLTEHAITRITTLNALLMMETSTSALAPGYGSSAVLRSGTAAAAPVADRIFVKERRDD